MIIPFLHMETEAQRGITVPATRLISVETGFKAYDFRAKALNMMQHCL
jgi:hypothetical protein